MQSTKFFRKTASINEAKSLYFNSNGSPSTKQKLLNQWIKLANLEAEIKVTTCKNSRRAKDLLQSSRRQFSKVAL